MNETEPAFIFIQHFAHRARDEFDRVADTIEISATVPGCGDGVVSNEERCDGGNLNNASCQSLGFGGGTLSCTSACAFSITTCTFMPLGTSRSASVSSLRRDVDVMLWYRIRQVHQSSISTMTER